MFLIVKANSVFLNMFDNKRYMFFPILVHFFINFIYLIYLSIPFLNWIGCTVNFKVQTGHQSVGHECVCCGKGRDALPVPSSDNHPKSQNYVEICVKIKCINVNYAL